MKQRLRWKINGAILITFAMLAVIFSAVFLPFQKSRLDAERTKAQTLLAAVTTGSKDRLTNAVFEHRTAAIHMLLDQMVHVPGITEACLFDVDNDLIASKKLGEVDSACDQWNAILDNAPVGEPIIQTDDCNNQQCLVYIESITAIGKEFGYLVLSYSLADIRSVRSHYFVLFVSLLAAMLFCLIVFLNYILGKTILKPLSDMGETMEHIAKGNSEIRVRIVEDNEIGRLGKIFNRLLDRLQAKQHTIVRAEKQYRDIFENAAEGIFQARPDMTLERMNPAMQRLVGAGPHRLDILLPEPGDFFERLYAQGEVSAVTLPVVGIDGKQFFAAVSARIVYNEAGKPVRYDGSLFDITTQVEHDEIERRRQTAELSTQAKSEFLANMSHELRTPMNAIIGLSQLAIDSGAPPQQLHYLDSINKAGKSLLCIVNDILDYSKIEAGKLSLHPVAIVLDDVLTQLLDVLNLPAAQKGLDFVLQTSDSVPHNLEADPVRLGQILMNLAGNAIKFTASGNVVIEIQRVSASETATELRFSVHDTGIGINPEVQDQLFRPFTQADSSTTRNFGGTGLGLSICKSIADLMNGQIWLESTPGAGSHFHFQAWFNNVEEAPRPACDKQLIMKPVLLLTDSVPTQRAFTEILEGMGILTIITSTLQDARHMLQERAFSLFLVDTGHIGEDVLTSFVEEHSDLAIIPLVPVDKREQILPVACALKLRTMLSLPFTRTSLMRALDEQFYPESGSALSTLCVAEEGTNSSLPMYANARVLVAEDNAFNRILMQGILQQLGIHPIMVHNGRQAVEAVLYNDFDLVFMDIQMPEMDGLEATQIIRSHHNSDELPIIALTAHTMDEHINASFKAGMNSHLAKPLNPQRINAILSRYINRDKKHSTEIKHYQNTLSVHHDILNLDYAKRLIGSEESGLSKLLELFRSETCCDVEKLKSALESKQWERAAMICHTIKGASQNLGALNLAESARALEDLLRSGDVSLVTHAFEELLNANSMLNKHLEEL